MLQCALLVQPGEAVSHDNLCDIKLRVLRFCELCNQPLDQLSEHRFLVVTDKGLLVENLGQQDLFQRM